MQSEAVAAVWLEQASPSTVARCFSTLAFTSEDILLTGPVTGDLLVRWIPRISAVSLATAIRGGAGRNMGSILPTEKDHLHATLSHGDAGFTGEVRGFGIAYKYRSRVTMSFPTSWICSDHFGVFASSTWLEFPHWSEYI